VAKFFVGVPRLVTERCILNRKNLKLLYQNLDVNADSVTRIVQICTFCTKLLITIGQGERFSVVWKLFGCLLQLECDISWRKKFFKLIC